MIRKKVKRRKIDPDLREKEVDLLRRMDLRKREAEVEVTVLKEGPIISIVEANINDFE